MKAVLLTRKRDQDDSRFRTDQSICYALNGYLSDRLKSECSDLSQGLKSNYWVVYMYVHAGLH